MGLAVLARGGAQTVVLARRTEPRGSGVVVDVAGVSVSGNIHHSHRGQCRRGGRRRIAKSDSGHDDESNGDMAN